MKSSDTALAGSATFAHARQNTLGGGGREAPSRFLFARIGAMLFATDGDRLAIALVIGESLQQVTL